MDADRAELRTVIDTLLAALSETGNRLSEFQSNDPKDRTGPRLIDAATWDALRGRIRRDFGPPELVRRLAFYWLQLDSFNRLHRSILELGVRGELLGDALNILGSDRKLWAQELASEASALQSVLSTLRESTA